MASTKQAKFAQRLLGELEAAAPDIPNAALSAIETVVASVRQTLVELISNPESVSTTTASRAINQLLAAKNLIPVADLEPDQQRWLDWARTQPTNGFLSSLVGQFDRQKQLSSRQWECLSEAFGKAQRELRGEGQPVRTWELNELLGDAPDGRYALPSKTGANDLDFWVVSTNQGRQNPTNKGKRWIRRYLGGQDAVNITPSERRIVAEAIGKLTAEEAAEALARFGREVGTCGACGRSLTDEVSREAGLGPDCRARLGAGLVSA